MNVSDSLFKFIESRPWDEDDKQELYIRVLEYNGPEIRNTNAWISVMYYRMLANRKNTEVRRREILTEAASTIEGLIGEDENQDPYDYLVAEEVLTRHKKLSPVLSDTIEEIYIKGKTPEELATEQEESSATIYKRIERAKKALAGVKE